MGWYFLQNTNISDSRSIGFIYFNNNTSPTKFGGTTDFVKMARSTTTKVTNKFTSTVDNQVTYVGRRPIDGLIDVIVNAEGPKQDSSYTIATAKNGTVLTDLTSTVSAIGNGNGFQIALKQETPLVTGDELEVFIRANTNTNIDLIVDGLQFNVSI